MIMVKDEHVERIEKVMESVMKAAAVHGWIHEEAENCLAMLREARGGYKVADRH